MIGTGSNVCAQPGCNAAAAPGYERCDSCWHASRSGLSLQWLGVAGGSGHITLCWGGWPTRGDLRHTAPITFKVKRKWENGGGYDLEATDPAGKPVEPGHCIDTGRWPLRNDGGSPGSTQWWHCTGGELTVGAVVEGTFDRTTLSVVGGDGHAS